MKDLTKEMHFEDNTTTTFGELERLAEKLLKTTWTIDIYRYQDAKVINLWDLGWRFEYDTKKRAAGFCNYREKTIYLSKYLVAQNLHKSLEFENTLRHELAHALDGAMGGRNHHNQIWKMIARKVLCTAERCYKSEDISDTQSKYTLVCENGCGKKIASHKKKKIISACGKCCNEHNSGRFTEKYALTQIQNY
jgi:predicted SprT family Zn-dependent metalloprotease